MANQDYPKKIILVGDVGVGKTSLILRYCENTFEENTIGIPPFESKTKQITVGKKTHTLHIWDTAGQERFGTITASIYRKAKGVAYVYDSSREETFTNLKQWIEEVNRKYNEVQTTNVVIIANKTDLPNKVPVDVAQKFAETNKAIFIQVSAKTGDNIETIFTTLAKGFDADQASGGGGSSANEGGPQRIRASTSKGDVKGGKKRTCVIL